MKIIAFVHHPHKNENFMVTVRTPCSKEHYCNTVCNKMKNIFSKVQTFLVQVFFLVVLGLHNFECFAQSNSVIPKFSLTNQLMQKVDETFLEGHIDIIYTFFSRCPQICPTLHSDIKYILNQLSEENRQKIHLLGISIDPDFDTPERLKEFADRHQIQNFNWMLVSDSREHIKPLLRMIDPLLHNNDPAMHSNQVTLINKQGQIQGQFVLSSVNGKKRLQTILAMIDSE